MVALMRDVLGSGGSLGSAACKKKIVPTLAASHPSQPLYSHLFDYCDRILRGKICMVCNADIFLPPSFAANDVKLLMETADARNRRVVLALTRYESEGGVEMYNANARATERGGTGWSSPLIDDYRGSHDAFIFRSPLGKDFTNSVQHRQNCYKAENIVVHELLSHGCCVVNPCKSVRIVHLHEADVRQWLPSVDEERYGRAYPTTTEEAVAEIRQEPPVV